MKKTITIPYGNWGRGLREFEVLGEYKGHALINEKDFGQKWDWFRVVNMHTGLVLLKNRLNEHLPEPSPDTWMQWVDWVLALPPTQQNFLDVRLDLSGHAPNGEIGSMPPASAWLDEF